MVRTAEAPVPPRDGVGSTNSLFRNDIFYETAKEYMIIFS